MVVSFRIVKKSEIVFESDLPHSSSNIHPSGMLHAFRSAPLSLGEGGDNEKKGATKTPKEFKDDDGGKSKKSGDAKDGGGKWSGDSDDDDKDRRAGGGGNGEETAAASPELRIEIPSASAPASKREHHTYVWVANTLNIDAAFHKLASEGYDRQRDVVFIPYTSLDNWIGRYPHAAPGYVCEGDGDVVPYDDGSDDEAEEGGGAASQRKSKKKKKKWGEKPTPTEKAAIREEKARQRRYQKRANTNMLNDRTCIPDIERDELHIEIYNYLSWLHDRLSELDEGDGDGVPSHPALPPLAGEDNGGAQEEKQKNATRKRRCTAAGVDKSELKGVIDKLEKAFLVIPNVKAELAAAVAAEGVEQEKDDQDEEENKEEGEPKTKKAKKGKSRKKASAPPGTPSSQQKGPPFLEVALSKALTQLVEAGGGSEKMKRRSRKRAYVPSDNPNRKHSRTARDFDERFDLLAKYKSEHGNCLVPRSYPDKTVSYIISVTLCLEILSSPD